MKQTLPQWPWDWKEFHAWKKVNPQPVTPKQFLKNWLPDFVRATTAGIYEGISTVGTYDENL